MHACASDIVLIVTGHRSGARVATHQPAPARLCYSYLMIASRVEKADSRVGNAGCSRRSARLICSHIAVPALLAATLLSALSPDLRAQGDQLKRGLSLIKASQPAAAERALSEIPPSDGDYYAAQTVLGFLLMNRSELSGAAKSFLTVLKAHPDDAEARLGYGTVLLKRGSFEDAGVEFAKIAEDNSVGLRAQMQQVQALLYSGRIEESRQMAGELSAAHESVADLHSMLGFFHQLHSATREALEEYLRAAELAPNDINKYLDVIASYQVLGDWEHALHYTLQALALDPNSPILYQSAAGIYEKLGRTAEAGAARSKSERMYDAEMLYAQAAKSRASGRSGEAQAALRQAVKKNPGLSKAWCDLGELLAADRKLDEARAAFAQALEASPMNVRAVVGIASVLGDSGREDEALRYCREAVDKGLIAPDVLSAMASIFMSQGRIREAVSTMQQAVEKLPDNPDLLSYLGYLQQSMGNTTEARASFAAALRLNPQQVHALIGQARSLLSQGNTKEALASFNLAKALNPGNTEIMIGLMEAYLKAGSAGDAEAVCRECLTISPRNLDCREQLATLRMEAGEYGEATALLQGILRDGRVTKNVLDSLAYSLMKQGSFERAIVYAERSAAQFSSDIRGLETLAYLHRCRGDIKRAASYYRLARDAAPMDPEKNYNLGLALYLASDFRAAAAPLEAAVRLRSDYGPAHYYLALVYWNLKHYAPALASARRAQELAIPAARSIVETLTAGQLRIRKKSRPN